MSHLDIHDAADRQTAAAVSAAFADVRMTLPLPAPVVERRHGRWVAAAAGVAAATVAAAATVPALVGGGSAAWAAVPSAATSADTASAVVQCAEPFAADGTRESLGREIPQLVPIMESTLQVLDIRGAGAVAIFGEGSASYVCTLARVDGAWRFAGASGADTAGPAGVVAAMSAQLPDGGDLSSVHGAVDTVATKVLVTLASGAQAEASLGSASTTTPFAAWFPVPVEELAGATITVVDADGRSTTLPGSVDIRQASRN